MPQQLRKRHSGHARPLKHLDERFEWYAAALEMEPASCKGRWKEAHLPRAREVRLDLGCGKGSFAVACAEAQPDVLFVGLDCDRHSIALAAERACKQECGNVVFTLADAEDICELFAAGELARLYLNFPTPHPRKKHATERLTYVDALVRYRNLLGADALIDFRTDSPMFHEFTLAQLALAAYDVVFESTDLTLDEPEHITSEYERRLCEKGAHVHAIRARVAQREPCTEQNVPLSLFEYLPDDLDTLDYVPYGMEAAVDNFKRYRAKHGPDFER